MYISFSERGIGYQINSSVETWVSVCESYPGSSEESIESPPQSVFLSLTNTLKTHRRTHEKGVTDGECNSWCADSWRAPVIRKLRSSV